MREAHPDTNNETFKHFAPKPNDPLECEGSTPLCRCATFWIRAVRQEIEIQGDEAKNKVPMRSRTSALQMKVTNDK